MAAKKQDLEFKKAPIVATILIILVIALAAWLVRYNIYSYHVRKEKARVAGIESVPKEWILFLRINEGDPDYNPAHQIKGPFKVLDFTVTNTKCSFSVNFGGGRGTETTEFNWNFAADPNNGKWTHYKRVTPTSGNPGGIVEITGTWHIHKVSENLYTGVCKNDGSKVWDEMTIKPVEHNQP